MEELMAFLYIFGHQNEAIWQLVLQLECWTVYKSFVTLMKVDSQFPVTLLRLETNVDQIIHYFELNFDF